MLFFLLLQFCLQLADLYLQGKYILLHLVIFVRFRITVLFSVYAFFLNGKAMLAADFMPAPAHILIERDFTVIITKIIR